MIIDANNNMIGRAPHVREIGPHACSPALIGADGSRARYYECLACGARTTDAPAGPSGAERRDWLMGGPWDDSVAVAPATREEVAAAIADERARRPVPVAPSRVATMPVAAPLAPEPIVEPVAAEDFRRAEPLAPAEPLASAQPAAVAPVAPARRGPGRPPRSAA